ncbi:hypothetical protein [Yoonia sp. 2307UL14-13]|uniref:hypothetical protein n=1 Tax=Yoonia sp. 2307UL14-13 TaxID=3126506 RepID=UPI0030B0C69F
MGENSKILSVSYGTFSCRLEGFEDSVETMKAVVSYFHELAGHERFMDMEPQAPDLEALEDLVQETEEGPVEAEMTDEGVSLRVAAANGAADEEDMLRPSLRILPTADDDDVTEELSAVEQSSEEILSADDGVDAENPSEPDQIDIEDSVVAFDGENDAVIAEDEEPADVAAPDDTAQDDDATGEDENFYDPAPTHDAPDAGDSVAAKLERIRALVGRTPPRGHESRSDEEQPGETASVVDRLSALTGTPDGATDEEEDVPVDDFDFSGEDVADTPLILSDIDPDDDEASDPTVEDEVAPAEMSDDDDVEADEEADDHDAPALRREIFSRRENLPENDDDAMSRIMSQADERLNEPEGRRHRDAFAQLKAAVAATEAARQLGDRDADADPKDAFRDDLTEVTKPKENEDRPISRPISRPLKLVAEQLIETPPADPAERLRQIASVKETGEAKGGFAEFAAEKGATELSDLLEAAAAYISFVEGDTDFSRPQVMKKVQMAANDEFSREDGLRSFGRLLRQSRIIKLNNGRFQVSEDTRFRPDGNVAQG